MQPVFLQHVPAPSGYPSVPNSLSVLLSGKVQAEIDEVIGRERPATMKDQLSMPYTNAVIHEVQRYASISPLGLPHMTYRDTEVQGFFIPKVTVTREALQHPLLGQIQAWGGMISSPSCSHC